MFECFSDPTAFDGNVCEQTWQASGEDTEIQGKTLESCDLTITVAKIPVTGLQRGTLRRLQSEAARDVLRCSLMSRHRGYAQTPWLISPRGSGRPQATGPTEVDVSLSHCACWVATAFSAQFKVGIDIETIDTPLSPQTWALFLSPHEIDWLTAHDPNTASLQATALWCRKEAWLKASGFSEQIPMTEIVFSSSGQLLSTHGTCDSKAWNFQIWQISTHALFALAHGCV